MQDQIKDPVEFALQQVRLLPEQLRKEFQKSQVRLCQSNNLYEDKIYPLIRSLEYAAYARIDRQGIATQIFAITFIIYMQYQRNIALDFG
jgi:hypothetical protein